MRAAWWWIDRWRKSTARTDMSLAERGAYRELLDETWLREDGILPASDKILARIAGCSDEEWCAVREVVMSRFDRVETGWKNDTACEVKSESETFYRRQKAKGLARAAGAARSPGGTFAHQPDTSRTTSRTTSRASSRGVQPDTSLPSPSPSPSPSPYPSPSPSPTTASKRDHGRRDMRGATAPPLPVTAKIETTARLTVKQAALLVFDYWRVETKHKGAQWSPKRETEVIRCLDGEPGKTLAEKVEGLKLAVQGAVLDPWFNGTTSDKPFNGFENVFVHKGRDRIETLQAAAVRARGPKLDRSTRETISALDAIGGDE